MRSLHGPVSVLLCLLLTACDPAGGSGKNKAAVPVDPNLPAAGLYEIKTTYEAFVAGEPPESRSDVEQQCVRVDPAHPDSFMDLSNGDCRTLKSSFKGGEVKAETMCIWPDRGGEVHFESHGTYSKESIDVADDGTIDDGMPVRMTQSYRRIGAC